MDTDAVKLETIVEEIALSPVVRKAAELMAGKVTGRIVVKI
jgi:hypothetical protein